MVSKNQFFAVAILLIVGFVIFTQPKSTVTNEGKLPIPTQNELNQTVLEQTNATTGGSIIEAEKIDFLPWLLFAAAILYILWKQFKGGNQYVYEDEQDAKRDLDQRLKGMHIYPYVIESFDFTDQTRTEAQIQVRIFNRQHPDFDKVSEIRITKAGYFRQDTVKPAPEPLKDKPKIVFKSEPKKKV